VPLYLLHQTSKLITPPLTVFLKEKATIIVIATSHPAYPPFFSQKTALIFGDRQKTHTGNLAPT
jgi:hypothetical protein